MKTDPSKIIPTSDSTAEVWIEWHKALLGWFNKNESNTQWLRFWNQRAGAGTDADTHDLRQYMEGEGVNLTTDMQGSVTDSVMGFFDFFGDTAKWLRNIIIGGIILVIGIIAYFFIHNIRNNKPLTGDAGNFALKNPELLKLAL